MMHGPINVILVLFEHAISVLERSKFVHVSNVVAAVTGKRETVLNLEHLRIVSTLVPLYFPKHD